MNATPTPIEGTRDWMRPLRYVVRVPLLLWHLFVHLPITLLCLLPPVAASTLASGERVDQRMIRWWQGGLMRVFGFRLKRVGEPRREATLFVANHCSWLDITLLHSQRAVSFVAKAEIAHWPVVGWVASRGGTIYHQRGSNDSLVRVSQTMIDRLNDGLGVGVFPEGGTGEVDKVRTFHARIFQTCYDANVPAQPVALRYLRDGVAAKAVAFRAKEAFFPNFLRLLGEPATTAEVHFLEPVPLATEGGRKRMAEAARRAIIVALGFEAPPPLRAKNGDAADDLDPIAESDHAAEADVAL
ncbi:MAG TPA: lysophospholipid acyltransferase family protein [Patescibacteria group bacterium]|nr:lysophospholipid acyltransferase family protein [Patescibacteria group bacterium]